MPLVSLLPSTSHPFPILPFTTTRAHRRDLVIVNGGGPRTFPGGVTKWQWKRMQAKKSNQLLKARLARERQLYEMRKRAEMQAAVADLELPWEEVAAAPNLLSASADDQVKALADRFHRPGGMDMWNERDGPQVFVSPDGVSSARFFPKNAVYSVRPYQIARVGRVEDGERRQGVCGNGDGEEEFSESDDVSDRRNALDFAHGKNRHKERGRGRENGKLGLNRSRSWRPGDAMNDSGEYGKYPKERMRASRFDGAVDAMNEHDEDGTNVRRNRLGGRRYNGAVGGINGGQDDGSNFERHRKDRMRGRRYNGVVDARSADDADEEDGDKVGRYQSNGMGRRRFNGVPRNADEEDGDKARRYHNNRMGGQRFNGAAANARKAGEEGAGNFSRYRNDRMRGRRYIGAVDDMNSGDEDGDSLARYRDNRMGRGIYNEDDEMKGDEEAGDNVGRWKNSKLASKSSGRGSMNRRGNRATNWKPDDDDAMNAIDDDDDDIAGGYQMDRRRGRRFNGAVDSMNYGEDGNIVRRHQKNQKGGQRFNGVARNILRPTSKLQAEDVDV